MNNRGDAKGLLTPKILRLYITLGDLLVGCCSILVVFGYGPLMLPMEPNRCLQRIQHWPKQPDKWLFAIYNLSPIIHYNDTCIKIIALLLTSPSNLE